MVRLVCLTIPLLIYLVLVSIGCSGGSGAPTYPTDLSDAEGISKFIRADQGGSIEAPGARLRIPPNALPADTEITLKVLQPGWLIGGKEIAGGVEILPHLIELQKPVIIEFPASPGNFKPCSFLLAQYLDVFP